MMVCPSCRAEGAAGDAFCGSCGFALAPAPTAQLATPETWSESPHHQGTYDRRDHRSDEGAHWKKAKHA